MSSPDFAQQWIDPQETDSDSIVPTSASPLSANSVDESVSTSQQQAFEALVDRVNAARSIV